MKGQTESDVIKAIRILSARQVEAAGSGQSESGGHTRRSVKRVWSVRKPLIPRSVRSLINIYPAHIWLKPRTR